ncbi:P-loop NTPase fold protein [Streptomyces chartreusis]|uniref:P-loop NTPase fold protein n=1 Tax=Streptomyces chartreusis TaxID=1969 RepID=UPI00364743DA
MNDRDILALLTDWQRDEVERREGELLGRAVDEAAERRRDTPGDLVLDDSVRADAQALMSADLVREERRHWYETNSGLIMAKRRRRNRVAWAVVPVLLVLLMVLLWLDSGAEFVTVSSDGKEQPTGVAVLIFGGLMLLLAILVVWSPPARDAVRRAEAQLRGAEDRFALALRTAAESLLSTVLNERWQQSKDESAVLENSTAPILVELDTVKAVPSKSTDEVFGFIEEHETSAIGISGPRGVGKTTLMQAVQNRNPAGYIGVYIPLPVQYAVPEFFRTLFREVATAILSSNPQGRDYLERKDSVLRQRIDLVRLLIGPAFVIAGLVLIAHARSTKSFPVKAIDIPGLLLVLAGVGIAVVAGLSSPAVHRVVREFLGSSYIERDISLATDMLRALDYSATHQRLSKNAFAVKLLTMEDHDQLELAERELTHPELVMKFKDFVSTFIRASPQKIIVALDELDKMENGEDALAFVNGIKDILHIQGIHFLVSVSEDALHNFSLRGVPVRDVFDSSFDSIIPVERFTIDESKSLLKSRVVGFPDPLGLFCHAMSGGVPRDLIRVARNCVRVAKESVGPVPVDQVVRTVVSRQASLVCEALAAKMRQDHAPVTVPFLEALQAIRKADDTGALVTAIEETELRVRDGALAGYAPAGSTAVYLLCLSTLCAYFGVGRTNEQWALERSAGVSPRVAETAAGVLERLAFEFESGMARSALTSLRAELAATVAP